MASPAVAVLLSASTLLYLYLLALPDPTSTPTPVAHRRSGRHRPPSHHVAFDPLVGDLELHHGSNEHGLPDLKTFHATLDGLSVTHDWSKFEAELGPLNRYFGSDGRLDVKERLMYLFPLLDRFPKDGGISSDELEGWLHQQATDRLVHITQMEMEKHDGDGDGFVTLHKYLSVAPDQELDWSDTEHGELRWWREKFASADRDKNGSLDADEFNDFLHPEDSNQEEVQLWLQKNKLREIDRDGDGRLSLEEFVDQYHLLGQILVSENDGGHDHHRVEAEKKFRELDGDMDKYLTVEELKPIIQSLLKGEFSYATSYAKFLMEEVDDNGDGKLSLEEMLNHHMAFYNAVYMDDHYDYDNCDDFHDELR